MKHRIGVGLLVLFTVLTGAFSSTAIHATDYFVRPHTIQFNGDGTGPDEAKYEGEPGKAWKGFSSIKWDKHGVAAGDRLHLIGGLKYTETLTVGERGSVSGTKAMPIVITVYGAGTAEIDCENERKVAINLGKSQHIVVDGVRGDAVAQRYDYGIKITNLAAGAGGIYSSMGPSNILIKRVEITGTQTSALEGMDHQGAIRIAGPGSNIQIGYCWIHGPDSEVTQRWAAAGIQVWAPPAGKKYNNIQIFNNKIENIAHDAIKTNNNASIFKNEIARAWSPGVHADNIVVQSGSYIRIYNNFIHDNDRSQSIFIENYTKNPIDSIYIYNNIIDNPDAHSVVVSAALGDIRNVYITGNTFVATATSSIRAGATAPITVKNLNISNNKFGRIKDNNWCHVSLKGNVDLRTLDRNTYSQQSPVFPKVIDLNTKKFTLEEAKRLPKRWESKGQISTTPILAPAVPIR